MVYSSPRKDGKGACVRQNGQDGVNRLGGTAQSMVMAWHGSCDGWHEIWDGVHMTQ